MFIPFFFSSFAYHLNNKKTDYKRLFSVNEQNKNDAIAARSECGLSPQSDPQKALFFLI
jgi:hypothetical protein